MHEHHHSRKPYWYEKPCCHLQLGPCFMCLSGCATLFNHCTLCGDTLESQQALLDHLDRGCLKIMLESMHGM